MAKVADGDQEAFEALYLQLSPGTFGLALCMLGDWAQAEEVTQDVFAALWAQAPSFDTSRGTVQAWAVTITYRLALEVAQREPPPNVSAHTAPTERPGDDMAADPGVNLGLEAATDQQRLAIALVYFGGLTPGEVAQVVGLPAPTVTTQIRDGLRQLGRTG